MIGPEAGWLSCGQVGAGRMAEPGMIVREMETVLAGVKE